MSMSDCESCWSTPCMCGHGYKDRKLDYLISLREVIDKVINEKLAEIGETKIERPYISFHPDGADTLTIRHLGKEYIYKWDEESWIGPTEQPAKEESSLLTDTHFPDLDEQIGNLMPPLKKQVAAKKYKGVVCRGSWLLGSNCKTCERCVDTKPVS
jgi:hypothetical protein